MLQAATTPEKTADAASGSCFSKRIGGAYEMSVRRLLWATTMGDRVAGWRTRRIKNRYATNCIIAVDSKNTISEALKVVRHV
jgi:hypothetical protein